MATKPKNGYVPANALVLVEPGIRLETATAAAYLRAKAASKNTINIAKPGGGYRDFKAQGDLKAGRPTFDYWNINPAMAVKIASAGNSTHGWGTAVDIVGSNAWMLSNGAKYGFSRPFGAKDPNHWQFNAPTWASATTGTQRIAGPLGVKRRVAPSSKAAEAGTPLVAGTVGNFDGWIRGESVGGNPVWFRGTSGNWFWSGGFTDKGTHDLKDLNPVTVVTRTVGKVPLRTRAGSNIMATEMGLLKAGSTQPWKYWTKGGPVSGNDIWFVTEDKKTFAWSGGFTDPKTTGLVELPVVAPPPAPVPPTQAQYDAVVAERDALRIQLSDSVAAAQREKTAKDAALAVSTKLQAIVDAVKKAVT